MFVKTVKAVITLPFYRYAYLQELDASLYQRVVNHYEYIWMRTKGVVPKTMFDSLPQALWGSVSLSLYEKIIRYFTFSHFDTLGQFSCVEREDHSFHL